MRYAEMGAKKLTFPVLPSQGILLTVSAAIQ